ncbi:hypothetical protein TNCV_2292751 [Trichonephila clavipes]|nr:hypothetical protein TNCV_2292751 [Trichonephila clavipes]
MWQYNATTGDGPCNLEPWPVDEDDPHQPQHTTHSAFGRQSIAQWPFPCMGEEIEADGPFGYDGHLLRPSRKSWSNAETDSHRNARWGGHQTRISSHFHHERMDYTSLVSQEIKGCCQSRKYDYFERRLRKSGDLSRRKDFHGLVLEEKERRSCRGGGGIVLSLPPSNNIVGAVIETFVSTP